MPGTFMRASCRGLVCYTGSCLTFLFRVVGFLHAVRLSRGGGRFLCGTNNVCFFGNIRGYTAVKLDVFVTLIAVRHLRWGPPPTCSPRLPYRHRDSGERPEAAGRPHQPLFAPEAAFQCLRRLLRPTRPLLRGVSLWLLMPLPDGDCPPASHRRENRLTELLRYRPLPFLWSPHCSWTALRTLQGSAGHRPCWH